MSKILTHSDNVSGITIFDDGTKVYWTEGFSDCVAILPNGKRLVFDPYDLKSDEERSILDEETGIEENGADIYADMTPEEEEEWEIVRHPELHKIPIITPATGDEYEKLIEQIWIHPDGHTEYCKHHINTEKLVRCDLCYEEYTPDRMLSIISVGRHYYLGRRDGGGHMHTTMAGEIVI